MADILCKPSGTFTEVRPMNGRNYTSNEIYSYIGEPIAFLIMPNSNRLVVYNHEGKERNMLPNRIATGWMVSTGAKDYICGNALLIDAVFFKPIS